MNRKTWICAIVAVIGLAGAYSAGMLLLPFEHNTVFWMSWAFTVIAVLLQLPVLWLARKRGMDEAHGCAGWAVLFLGVGYLVSQLTLGIVIASLEVMPVVLAAVAYGIVLAVVAVSLLAFSAVQEEARVPQAFREE